MTIARFFAACSLLTSLAALTGCGDFDPAPDVSLQGNTQSRMSTSTDAPLVIAFTEPVLKKSLRVKLLALRRGDLDGEGNLPDEPEYRGGHPDRELFDSRVLTTYDAGTPTDASTLGFTWSLSNDRRTLTLEHTASLSLSTPYLLLFEPGLEDDTGHATVPRMRIPFTFPLSGGGPTKLATGYYFFNMNLAYLSQQLQLSAKLDIDQATGDWSGIFTDADRVTSEHLKVPRDGCGPCSGGKVCKLSGGFSCVLPSDKILSLEEWTDLFPVPEPKADGAPPGTPDGYTFRVTGYARDEADGSIAFGTAPFVIDITIGGGVRIQTLGTVINGVFRPETYAGADRLVAAGNVSVDAVQVNGGAPSPTTGDLTAMTLSDAEGHYPDPYGWPVPTLDYPNDYHP